ncbi:MAG: tRNA uridine-5-carboxymethylaminomethyl(34) synthesis GTPase MnmE [Thermodesulfobacteriota bacterium]|nr:tRNA uridine-5-carboxymethylaminomethyl(34) synthesis GTPase MnmE [Thermodesulfobacteriota bacterium]
MAARPAISDTIAAIATAPGTGGIGIIRISGPESAAILHRLFTPYRPHSSLQSHKLYYGTIADRSGVVLDEVLAVFMQAPHTYTREDVVELHSHGSYLVLQAILAEVLTAGARVADGGEFTKRAFLSGRIDLTRAEAVIELLQARTSGGVRLAAHQLQGVLYEEIVSIRDALVDILAVVEVAIDFPDDDVEILQVDHLLSTLREQVESPLAQLIGLADQGKIIREGVKVVIAGRPNVGKSSLLNGLLREERALVTEIPGTTRDTIEELISVRGIPVHLVDTAGIRAHEDFVEELGIERARHKLQEADLVLFVVDAEVSLTKLDRELYKFLEDKKRIVVLNKLDIAGDAQADIVGREFSSDVQVRIAAREGMGLDDLLDAIYQAIMDEGDGMNEQVSCAPNLRHKMILEKTLSACRQLLQTLHGGAPADLVAVDLQVALDYLGDIVGLTTPDDVLDALFSRFCIGK